MHEIAVSLWDPTLSLTGLAMLLLIHYRFWPDPDWLRIVHRVIYGLVVLYWSIATVFTKVMLKRYLPNDLKEPDPPV